ncbi:MAG: hypothetical protein E7180_02715 [Erysipelotrichaceae bacterium]|nr:hypothetical protein [Erysipelotrichaceae bacterium]
MWEQIKSKHPSVMMKLEYEEFANIEVEKTISGAISKYVINVEIYDICNDSCTFFDLREVESSLKRIKKEIEELYNEIPLFDDNDLENWVEDFHDLLNEF